MDELNVHQFWGISPYVDLLDASASAGACLDSTNSPVKALLQICPYDCRHTLATISSHISSQTASSTSSQPHSSSQQTSASHANAPQQPQRHTQQLQLYVYESDPEVLARHMLLLAILFDPKMPVQERAEVFLELHGNVMLRQKTADYLAALSRQLEEAVAQLSLCSAPAAATAGTGKHDTSTLQQQHDQQPRLGVLGMFDLSLLRYQERDALVEVFQRYRQKVSFNMAKAWDDRCRKWYADRYDFRGNMIDWDYHMRLAPRGTPFLDPALGSIIHFYHFRHWRLTGVAHELRDSSYVAANTSLLSTAYGRTKECKDRYLKDVGRSVSAFSYWGDLLNSPYHCFGTVGDDPELFKVTNKQFTHSAVDVAEHNLLGFIKQLRIGCQPTSDGDKVITIEGCSSSMGPNTSSSNGGQLSEARAAHRSNAARGPTSMENMMAQTPVNSGDAAAAATTTTTTNKLVTAAGTADTAGAEAGSHRVEATVTVDRAERKMEQLSFGTQQQSCTAGQQEQLEPQQQETSQQQSQHTNHQQPQQQDQQQQHDTDAFAQLEAVEAAITAASVSRLLSNTKIYLLTGDLKRSLTSKAKFSEYFSTATVGHRHVHMLSAQHGLAKALKPGGLVLVESGQNMVQLNNEQVKAFEAKVVELAAEGGFRRHSVLFSNSGSKVDGRTNADEVEQQKGAEQNAGGKDSSSAASSVSRRSGWRLPPGHIALEVVGEGMVHERQDTQ